VWSSPPCQFRTMLMTAPSLCTTISLSAVRKISEAIQSGAPMEFVRHAATHSDVSQTADYDRGQAEALPR